MGRCLFEDMSNTDRKEVKTLPGGTGFKFGGGSIVKSLGKYAFPCYIAGEKTTITADVVNRNIKAEMKKRGFKINLEDDSLEINGRRIDLNTTENGQYKIPLRSIEDVNIANIEKKSVEEKQKILEKLHS